MQDRAGRSDLQEIMGLLAEAKVLAKRYKRLTGRPLGITGEVGEFEAVRLLGLELAEVRQAGFDALRRDGETIQRIQIKARSLPPKAKGGQRLGSIQLDREWDCVVVVLLDEDLEPMEIYEADRTDIAEALLTPGSKARNARGALSISKFKSIGRCIWPRSG